jgi:UDP-N-acetylglucosamine 2-epimerase (non-hydrolysing)
VFGTRPEAIKMASVVFQLKNNSQHFESVLVATAQHREILDQVLSIFNITPDIDLNLMSSRQGLPALTSRVLESMEATLNEVKPDIVLVQGDTTTVFATALAAFYQKIPLAHVEAGLRSHNIYSPFPEEVNRCLTTVMTQIHFAPTAGAKQELLNEGVAADKIVVTGNTVVDALLHIAQQKFDFSQTSLKNIDFDNRRLILVTSHRRESWGMELQNICEAIKDIVKLYNDVVVVYPVHPNPAVRDTVNKILPGHDRIHLVEPLDYITFVNLMKKSYLLLTDSGGLQEEAPTLKKPLLLLRETTERPEAFEAGLCKIIGTSRARIVEETSLLLNNKGAYQNMIKSDNPYGDGHAAERIVQTMINWKAGKRPLLESAREFHMDEKKSVHKKGKTAKSF